MARYRFKVRDKSNRILAQNELAEADDLTACRSVAMALAVFAFNEKAPPSTSIELEDSSGNRVAVITLLVETPGQLTQQRTVTRQQRSLGRIFCSDQLDRSGRSD